jgi:hypothetical protein
LVLVAMAVMVALGLEAALAVTQALVGKAL